MSDSAENSSRGRRLEDLLDQSRLDGRIDIDTWAGGISQDNAQVPSVRIGRRWFSSLWLLPITIAGLIVAIALAQHLRQYEWMHSFIESYPGTSASYAPAVDTGFPAWLRWQHLFNIVFMMFLIRAGLQILADHPRLYLNAGSRPGTEWLRLRDAVPEDRMDPENAATAWTAKDDSVALPKWLGIPGFRHSIGLARWWHFSLDLFWLVNGIVFYVLLFSTGQWRRIVPRSWDVFPNAVSTAVQYASLDFPANEGFTNYNGLQILAYFATVFVAAPLAFVTGLLQAPSIAARFGFGRGVLNRQVARSLHFTILLWMIFFILVHTTMVFVTGFVGNLNHIVLGTETESYWALAIYVAVMLVLAVLWVGASPLTIRHPRIVQRSGRAVVGWVKSFMEWSHPKAIYDEKDISPFFWPNGDRPRSDEYRRLQADDWKNYELRVEGLVEKPITLSYAGILALPKTEQITQHYCIQGWSGIAKWGGVRVSEILDLVRPLPEAKWVVFYSFADGPATPGTGRYYDCHRLAHMREPMAILAYEMNGRRLNELHGAPLRLRNELELGFKQVKWIAAIELVHDFAHLGAGQGGYNEDREFFGYRMPI
ncbi:molybdopterin-dependent oxidoreductase [Antrihabitans stalactiti]|uniref:Oxidoreductase n=1 Tax=Antrihabitans stalactiti TaxID=2584121 RepID=A0A848K484_9NOCA|nr:molybdopterin-dependent oxidoreductase [Antrihabitans stalactiti]NMN93945.1 oxidoreductase [Antrihabitans stalactiti]